MYFEKLNSKQKEKALKQVNKLFDRHFWFEHNRRKHNVFQAQFPYEFSNVGVDKLTGEALKLYEKQNRESTEAISPIWDSITKRESLKTYIKGYVSPHKQRSQFRGWIRKTT